jgi:hypothetical protein
VTVRLHSDEGLVPLAKALVRADEDLVRVATVRVRSDEVLVRLAKVLVRSDEDLVRLATVLVRSDEAVYQTNTVLFEMVKGVFAIATVGRSCHAALRFSASPPLSGYTGGVGHGVHLAASAARPAGLAQSYASGDGASSEKAFVWFPFTEQRTTATAPKL